MTEIHPREMHCYVKSPQAVYPNKTPKTQVQSCTNGTNEIQCINFYTRRGPGISLPPDPMHVAASEGAQDSWKSPINEVNDGREGSNESQ